MDKQITLGMADDDRLFSRSLSLLLNGLPQFRVVMIATDGDELLTKLHKAERPPDLIMLDVNMKIKNGIETAKAVRISFPDVMLIALSINDNDDVILQMIRAGCCAYLLKDMDPDDFPAALEEVYYNGYYNGEVYKLRSKQLLRKALEAHVHITEREKQFLKLSSSDMTYKQIAAKMFLSERTIDGYRESIFEKFCVQSRVGMVLEAIRRQLISL